MLKFSISVGFGKAGLGRARKLQNTQNYLQIIDVHVCMWYVCLDLIASPIYSNSCIKTYSFIENHFDPAVVFNRRGCQLVYVLIAAF